MTKTSTRYQHIQKAAAPNLTARILKAVHAMPGMTHVEVANAVSEPHTRMVRSLLDFLARREKLERRREGPVTRFYPLSASAPASS